MGSMGGPPAGAHDQAASIFSTAPCNGATNVVRCVIEDEPRNARPGPPRKNQTTSSALATNVSAARSRQRRKRTTSRSDPTDAARRDYSWLSEGA